jgi:hypothetical protein
MSVSNAAGSPSRINLSLVVAATLWTTTPAAAQSVAEFYAGKQISFIVGASPGSGYDTQARLVARHLGQPASASWRSSRAVFDRQSDYDTICALPLALAGRCD